MYSNQARSFVWHKKTSLSIIVPTYNESENILQLLEAILFNIPDYIFAEIIVVDDSSPDGTGKMVDDYIKTDTLKSKLHIKPLVKIIHRENRDGLIAAILQGIKSSTGENILVMDADFSHPPEIIPSMVRELMLDSDCDLVVASRYIEGGSVTGWPFKRRLLSSGATKIARHSLKLRGVKDPMSGFFLFRRHILENVTFDTSGYKILLEMLVKTNGIRIKEIPYNFVQRKSGQSKLNASVMLDYLKAIWRLYRYGRKSRRAIETEEKRKSVLFFSKAARFYTIGASGLLINYFISFFLTSGVLSNFFYLHATTIGIACSITSNFVLNKAWTFEDRNFSLMHTLRQYGMYSGFSTIGAIIQLSLLYLFVESYDIQYALSLIFAVAIASIGNFLLNKKWTFREKMWS